MDARFLFPALLACLMLPACDGGGAADAPVNAVVTATKPADDGRAECAIGRGGQWVRNCRIEQDGDMLTLRHADGGFRRFRIVDDGRGVQPADGAEGARIAVVGDRSIEISVGDDRYRLPATMAASAR
ncbi:hypothetical protein WG908_07295 [Sphingobium sp. AN641]|uniref:hypothetical protein n=1 Tax=Sphingobium sp. AN641 TaxID=3133443 RepID=UPI0030C42604